VIDGDQKLLFRIEDDPNETPISPPNSQAGGRAFARIDEWKKLSRRARSAKAPGLPADSNRRPNGPRRQSNGKVCGAGFNLRADFQSAATV